METNFSRAPMSKWLMIALAAGIVIIANLFFNYSIALLYKEPAFDAFCPNQSVSYSDQSICEQGGGRWFAGQPVGYCDPNYACQKAYNDAHAVYNRNAFIIMVMLGIVSFVAGAALAIESLSIGFSWAGVVALIIASARYWSDAGNLMRVLILAIALAFLIWIAVKKTGKHHRVDRA